ncbi:MAG: IS200/IS605 family transposase [Bacteroidia bacterium]|nr:IS200/IS605 family transposase [Bacteroidia bacterium]
MKPGTYTQIYIHLIFSPKFREALLQPKHRERIIPYISSIINNKGHKPIIINGMTDHIHILFGLNPKQSLSDLVADIKRSSSHFINEEKIFPGKFLWQDGYAGFSYSRSQLDNIYKYIENQQIHHNKITFKEEYLDFLKSSQIEFKEEFLFNFF